MRDGAGLVDDGGREFVREMMFADDDFDIDAKVAWVAEHFNDAAHAVFPALWKFQDFNVDDHAVEIFYTFNGAWGGTDAIRRFMDGRNFHAFRNFQPLLNAVVGRDDEVAAVFDAKLANDGDVCAAEDFGDLTFGTTLPPAQAGDADDGAVAMHQFAGFVGREKDIAGDVGKGLVRDEKAEAVAMDGDAADGIFAVTANGDEMAGAEFDELAFFRETVERFFESVTIFASEVEFFNELFVGGAGVGQALDVFQQSGVRKSGESFGAIGVRLLHYPNYRGAEWI